MEINLLLLISFILVCLYFTTRFAVKGRPFLLIDSFITGLLFYATGATYLYFETPIFKFEKILLIALISLISGLLGAIVYLFVNKNKKYEFQFLSPTVDNNIIIKVLIFNVLICLAFIYSVITNQAVVKEILATFSSDANYTSVRKSITSGADGYFAPGYVKQFRDILGPICLVSLLYLKKISNKKLKNKKILIFSFPIVVFAMLMSGQRSIIIIFLLLYFLTILYSKTKIFKVKNILFASLTLLIFYYLSKFIGRVVESTSISNMIKETAFSFFDRLVLTVPYENSVYFNFWWNSSTGGLSWLSEIEKVLPGINTGFSNILHSLNAGSLQGNSVLGLPIDLYYAFGFAGVILMPFIYALLIGRFDAGLRNSKSIFLEVSRIFLFITLPFMYSPYGFLLYGGGIVLILNFTVNFLFKKIKKRSIIKNILISS